METTDQEEAERLYEQNVQLMVQLIVDHEFYASDYSTKSQPHAANLLQTLHDNLVRHNHYAAEREAAGKSTEDVDRARRLLQSLICATNRRVHKGMPSIYAYLLGKPNHYCSHSFQPWSVHQVSNVIYQHMRMQCFITLPGVFEGLADCVSFSD